MDRGTLLADRYEMWELLGRGGMGEVWATYDRVLRRRVALKVLPMTEDAPSDVFARFEREAVAAAQINHPNVAALFDRGIHEDVLFLVMELVEGVPLNTLIDTSGVLPLARALELAEQICTALEATHEAGVVHCDIKPNNVMVTAAGAAKVVDFGIAGLLWAKQLSVARSSRLAPAATAEYAAPEQLTAEGCDARSDLYALGGVLFAMLTGHAPFTAPNGWALIAAKMSVDAPRLEQTRPGLPPALADLVAQLLEREPGRRPQSAREVRMRLAQLRSDARTGERGGTTLVDDRLPRAAARFADRSTNRSGGPQQLPPDTGLFTGREEELRSLLDLAEQARVNGEPGTVVISAIDGMGGVGKTALAVRAAHRLAEHYPDGQLFLDLYGHSQGIAPSDPGDALATLLASLGVPPQQMPASLPARAAFYRDRLAGTRTLLVLDNAIDEAQIAPLLPASDTCLVLVTSRRRLKALDDAIPLPLDALTRGQAVTLLRRAARITTVPADDEAQLERAAELCGDLPLALLIAGSLLRTGGKAWNLALLIKRLSDRRPEDELAGYTDETRSVRVVFELSYNHLDGNPRRLFRRLGLVPGPEIDVFAAAALLDTDLESVGRLLERLADHSLLTAVAPGRFRPHELIRAYARSLTVTLDAGPERAAAEDRLLHYYAYAAQSASVPIARQPRGGPDGPAPAHAPRLQDPDAARTWLRAEYVNLVAAFTDASMRARDRHTVALAAGLAEIMQSDGSFSRALEIQQFAEEAAARSARPADLATTLSDLGRAHYVTGGYASAADAHERALEVYREIGNRHGEAAALNGLGEVQSVTGDHASAVDAHQQALEIYREIGNRHGEAVTLNELGQVRLITGDQASATDAHERALELSRQIGNRHAEATALIELGQVAAGKGDFPTAADTQERALVIYREIGNRLGEAATLNNLGQIRYLTGDYSRAVDAHEQALAIYSGFGHRHGEAAATTYLGRVHFATGDLPAATDAQERALDVYRHIGNLHGEAIALNNLGRSQLATGDVPRATENFSRAAEIYREVANRNGELTALADLGRALHASGDLPEAMASLTQALQISRQIGNRGNEAYVLNYYAAVIATIGDHLRVLEPYQQALAINRELNKPDDEAVSLEGIAEHHIATGDLPQGTAHLRQALEIYQRLGMRSNSQRVTARLAELTGQ